MTPALKTAAAIAALTFLVFCLSVCPTVPFGDGGELIAAAACLGVAHPPGYPLYTTLGWLALQVPIGEPALRMNLLSALFGALTCGALGALVLRATESRLAAFASGLALAVSSTFWWISVVTEVYALHLFLLTLLLTAGLSLGSSENVAPRGRALVAMASVLGLGLVHHPTLLLAVPAAAVLAVSGRQGGGRGSRAGDGRLPSWSWWGLALLAGMGLPLALGLSLMIRARFDPLSNWGDPSNLRALWMHLTAADYRHLDTGWSGLFSAGGWRRAASVLAAQFTPYLLPVAGFGLLVTPPRGVLRPTWNRLRLSALLLVVASLGFGLRYAAEDVEVFFLPGTVGLALGLGLAVARVAAWPGRPYRVAAAVLALSLVLAPLVDHGSSRLLWGFTAAADYGRDVLQTIPSGGVLFVEVDDAFPLLYLHQVLGERTDVTIYDRQGTLFRDVAAELSFPLMAGESNRAWRMRLEQNFIAHALEQDPARAVHFLGWPGYELPARYRLEPFGLTYRVVLASAPAPDDRAHWTSYREVSVREQARRVGDGFALAVAATYPLARGERALHLGHRRIAFEAFDEAIELSATSPSLLNYIGTLMGRRGEYARAIDAFERSIAGRPRSVRTWNNLALAHELRGDRAAARSAWQRSLELIPDQTEARAALQRLTP